MTLDPRSPRSPPDSADSSLLPPTPAANDRSCIAGSGGSRSPGRVAAAARPASRWNRSRGFKIRAGHALP
jgi:hypothetical protein